MRQDPAFIERAITEVLKDRVSSSKCLLLTGGKAGRISIVELTGLSLREIEGVAFNRHFVPTEEYLQEREKAIVRYSDIWEIIHKGSYPELYDVERDWQDYYSSYVATYLERDINELIAAEALKNSAVAGSMFETFVVSEILKSYSTECCILWKSR